jgi:hypothetical protein
MVAGRFRPVRGNQSTLRIRVVWALYPNVEVPAEVLIQAATEACEGRGWLLEGAIISEGHLVLQLCIRPGAHDLEAGRTVKRELEESLRRRRVWPLGGWWGGGIYTSVLLEE